MASALDGIRIIEIAQGIAGPYTGMLLAEQGAEVIKVEPPTATKPEERRGSISGIAARKVSLWILLQEEGRAFAQQLTSCRCPP